MKYFYRCKCGLMAIHTEKKRVLWCIGCGLWINITCGISEELAQRMEKNLNRINEPYRKTYPVCQTCTCASKSMCAHCSPELDFASKQ